MKRVDRYLLLGSRHNRLSEPHCMLTNATWADWVACEYDCPGRYVKEIECSQPRKELRVRPQPLEPTVTGDSRGFHSSLDKPVVHLFRDDAREFFTPYLPSSVVWGRVYRMEASVRNPTTYSTCQVPWMDAVEMNRGTTPIAPKYCPICERAYCWAADCRHMGILRWQIKDRPVLIDGSNYLSVHPDFYYDMKLKERFPDIKIVHKIKIYDRDPHGWVLPGDPEWTGTFHKPKDWFDIQPLTHLDRSMMLTEWQALFLSQWEEDQRERVSKKENNS